MTKTKRDWWKQERVKGFARFFWNYGVLKAGLWFGTVMIISTALIERGIFAPLEFLLLYGFYVFGFGGFMSAYFWHKYEKDFHQADRDDHAA